MPSPFPGMDPYLESPRWSGFHSAFLNQIGWELSEKLPPGYVAIPEERLVVEAVGEMGDPLAEQANVIPDVSVLRQRRKRSARSSTATLEPPLRMAKVIPTRHRESFLEIRDMRGQRLVTAIEVLSPTNKQGQRGEYLERRHRVLTAGANLVEIDLLLGGRRPPMKQPLPDSHYFVFVCRTTKQPLTDVWPISLRSALPSVPIPLRAHDADVILNLQQIFATVFDHVRYGEILDYTRPPTVRLAADDQEWLRKRLKAKRIQPAE